MTKLVKLADDYYLDSSSIMHNKEDLKTLLKIRKYKMSSTVGWKRIAYFTNMACGTVTIENDTSYGTVGQLNFACSSGWSSYLSKIFKVITNGNYFTKARIVRKGNSISYLELYQALEYERNFQINGINSINTYFYDKEVLGDVPDGYATEEIDF